MKPRDGSLVCREAILAGLKPDPIFSVSDWADQYRVLSPIASSEPGQWRTARTPYLKEIMDVLSSFDPTQEVVFMKGSQLGGPLDINTPIPTPCGFKAMRDLEVGDEVFGIDGKRLKVLASSPVFKEKECYRITFSDNSTIDCDWRHLWTLHDTSKKKADKRVTIRAREVFERHSWLVSGRKRNRFALDVCGPIDCTPKPFKIHPYVMGVWLGDGNSYSNQITCFEDDAEELKKNIVNCGHRAEIRILKSAKGRVRNILIDKKQKTDASKCIRGHSLGPNSISPKGDCRKCSVMATNKSQRGKPMAPVVNPYCSEMYSELFRLNLIGSKRIPREYLRGSIEQRLALLQGLMDTDGCIGEKGSRCEFSTASNALKEGVYELLMSLGIKCTVYAKSSGTRGFKGWPRKSDPVDHYRLSFMVYKDKPVFRLKRKLARIASRSDRRTTETERRFIKSVSRINPIETKCILVDSKDHLFLAGRSFLPTHNTEVGLNFIGYIVDHAPGPTMIVQPTEMMAQRFSRQRIDPIFEGVPRFKGKIKEKKSRDSGNTMLMKEFAGGIMIIAGANAPSGLRSMPVRYVLMDEIDAYPEDAGGEGDPIKLAQARTRTFPRKKIYKNSSPTVAGRSRIEAAYLNSDQRKYNVPCPHCDFYQVLVWEQLKWDKNDSNKVWYECNHCKKPIDEHFKTSMLAKGRWVAENKNLKKKAQPAGFHISSLYSPVGMYSWADAVKDFLEAKENPVQLKVFVNTVLGETWKEKGEAPDWERLYLKREKYPFNTLFERCPLITAGVDVQKNRIELEIVSWGPNMESYSMDYRVIEGDTAQPATFEKLDDILEEEFFTPDKKGRGKIRALAIDTGYNTQTVYRWCRGKGQRVLPIKGSENALTIVGRPSSVDVDIGGRKHLKGLSIWPVGVSTAKSEFYAWLEQRKKEADDSKEGEKVKEFPFGYCHFPEYEEEYFKMLTAEQLVKKMVRGYSRFIWQKVYNRNESLDCRIYARAAAYICGADRFDDNHWEQLRTEIYFSPKIDEKNSELIQKRGVRMKKSDFWD